MKTKIILTTAIIVLLFIGSCRRTDSIANRSVCNSGSNVQQMFSSADVTHAAKDMIYGNSVSGNWYGDVAKLRTRKIVLIPFLYQGVSVNNGLTEELLRSSFFSSNTGSIRDYFSANSWNQFTLAEGGIQKTYQNVYTAAAYNNATYSDATTNPQLYSDALTGAAINWDALDVNHDSQITEDEAVICLLTPELNIVTPSGAARTMSQQISFTDPNGMFWSIPAGNYVAVFGVASAAFSDGVNDVKINASTICHELCHALFHIKDKYFAGCGTGWTGHFDMMSDNCSFSNMNIVDKIKLGWTTPAIITHAPSETCYSFSPSIATPDALVLWDALVPEQYFVVEYRKRSAAPYNRDNAILEDGLAIWSVNENGIIDGPKDFRTSLVDGRYGSEGIYRSPNYQSGNSHYAGGETGVLLKNIGCANGVCPIRFIRYAGENYDTARLIHGISAVSEAGATMSVAIY